MTSPSPAASARTALWRTHLSRADVDRGWNGAVWTSSELEPGFAADQAIASWNLASDVTARIEIRARDLDGVWSAWLELAEWSGASERRSPAGPEAIAGAPVVATDVLTAAPGRPFDAAQLRITVHGRPSTTQPLHLVTVSFSAPDDAAPDDAEESDVVGAPMEPVGAAASIHPLSQRAYPHHDDLGGGPVWCSPTSLTMVLSAWGVEIPTAPTDTPTGADARVPWVARAVHDATYDGTGNWSFNAAVAGSLGMDAFVTRLRSLHHAQVLTDAGIPLVASIRFADRAELPGADYEAPSGHLLVVRGFSAEGDVLVADPANPGGLAGLRTYPRAMFDRAWAASRRTVYVVTPRGHTLPASPGDRSW